MRYLHSLILFTAVLFSSPLRLSVHAQTESEIKFYRDSGIQPLINGIQYGNFPPGVYLIPHDIMIEKGKTMSIQAGTTILFTQNAMLVVNGTLICSGTSDAPVVFRRLDNERYFEPLDSRLDTRWDGLYLPDSSRLKMKNAIISDSKYGIVVSGKEVKMVFDSVRFINNKFQNVKIGQRMMKITPNVPIVYHYPEQKGVFLPPAKVLTATETIQQNRTNSALMKHPKMRIGMGVMGGAGLIAAVSGFIMYNKYRKEYRSTEDEDEMAEAKDQAKTSAIIAAAGTCLFGAGTIGMIWTFYY